MEIFLLILILIAGLGFVIKGGDIVVDVCSLLGDITGISDVLIGSTLISFATTLPELTITLLGMSQGSVDLVLGNGFGTILVNICLVLGSSFCFARLKRVNLATQKKLMFMLVMVALLSLFATLKILNVFVGIIFLALFLLYFIKTFIDVQNDIKKKNLSKANETNSLNFDEPKNQQQSNQNSVQTIVAKPSTQNNKFEVAKSKTKNEGQKNGERENKKSKVGTKEKVLLLIKFVVGVLLIFGGAQLIINSTENLTNLLNISATFVGVMVVAVGSSLPEIVTSIASIKKKRLNLALGNVVGANIINLTLLFSLAMIMSGTKSLVLNVLDLVTLIPAVLIASLILTLPILIKKRTYRFQGVLLLLLYAIYCIIIILTI
ncbi:MAG: sodium:calcium antiporter [Christensenellales bacterium]